jgi:hypothetical protein
VSEDVAACACAAAGAVGLDGASDAVDAAAGAVLGVEADARAGAGPDEPPAAAPAAPPDDDGADAAPDVSADAAPSAPAPVDADPPAAVADVASAVELAVSARCGSFEATVARENPAGVSGASDGPSCDGAFAVDEALEEAVADVDEALEEAVPDPVVDPVIALEGVAVEAGGAVEAGEAVEAMEAVEFGEADDFPFFLGAPRLADAFAALPFEPSARAINKPSKKSNRGCDGESWRNLSTSARAVLKSSALNAASVCATRSVTSCGYSGA